MEKKTFTPLASLAGAVSRESDKFMLRLPEGMRTLVAKAAQASGRSMNAEIVYRLEQSFNPNPHTEFDTEKYEQLRTSILQDVVQALDLRDQAIRAKTKNIETEDGLSDPVERSKKALRGRTIPTKTNRKV